MNTLTSKYEYAYTNNRESHHHAYLFPPLLELIKVDSIINTQPLKILDLGCGNGSLSQQLAQQGFTNMNFKFAGRFPYFWMSMLCSSSLLQK